MSYEQYIQPSVRKLAEKQHGYLSTPSFCHYDGCGALVRFVGERKVGGAWHCPLCGIVLPYAFWELKHDANQNYIPIRLILELATHACLTCGEGNPPCRCERKRLAEAADKENEAAKARYQ